jgi:predicted phage terminase large subunit-like protein
VIRPSIEFQGNWHIDAICDHLQNIQQIRKLIINIPPRHSKSTTVSVMWPAWEWIDSSSIRYLTGSYSEGIAIRDSIASRRVISSSWYRRLWGDRYTMTSDQNEKRRYANNKGGERLIFSVGGATGEGGDRRIMDDPHNLKDANNPTALTNVCTWWDEGFSSRINNPATVCDVVIMQRCNEIDLTAHLTEREQWEVLSLPGEYEPSIFVSKIGWKDPRKSENEALWKDRFGSEHLNNLKISMGSYAYAGQIQQRPGPAEGGIVKRHWWRYWQPKDANLPPIRVRRPDGEYEFVAAVELPRQIEAQLQSWDMAFKDTVDSAYVAGQVWAKHFANKYLLDQDRRKLDFVATVKAVKDLSEKWPEAGVKLVEDKANGPAVISELRGKISGLIPVNPEGDKVARCHAVSPQIESGNVYLPHPQIAPWVNAFIEECAVFPNGRYADQVDSMTQALRRMSKGILVDATAFSVGDSAPRDTAY